MKHNVRAPFFETQCSNAVKGARALWMQWQCLWGFWWQKAFLISGMVPLQFLVAQSCY